MWVRSLGWEDLLEKGMATHSRIIAWRMPWTEEPGRLQPMGCTDVDTTEVTWHAHMHRDSEDQVLSNTVYFATVLAA